MLREEIRQQIVHLLQAQVQPAFVMVFGSFAQGTQREDSDLDIAYFSEKNLTNYERFLLAGELAQVCHLDVDLIDIKKIDTVFAAQIFSTGVLLDCTDESEFFKQRMRALSMYVSLNEQRAEILRSIEERGSVYGDT